MLLGCFYLTLNRSYIALEFSCTTFKWSCAYIKRTNETYENKNTYIS